MRPTIAWSLVVAAFLVAEFGCHRHREPIPVCEDPIFFLDAPGSPCQEPTPTPEPTATPCHVAP